MNYYKQDSCPYISIKKTSDIIDLNNLINNTDYKKIGLVWAGNPKHIDDSYRSCSLESFSSFLHIENAYFFSFQYGDEVKNLHKIQNKKALFKNIIDLSDYLEDGLDKTAELLSQIDLLISVDTVTAHLAGSMGIPTYLMISKYNDWRWLDNKKNKTKWYPSFTLFRQLELNNWYDVISDIIFSIDQDL